MNKVFIKTLICLAFIAGVIGFTACEDYLDKSPQSNIAQEVPFKNFKNFQGFTEELYNAIPLMSSHHYHNSFNFGEDDYLERSGSYNYYLSILFDQGDFWAWGSGASQNTSWFSNGGNTTNNTKEDKGNLWGLAWKAIRKANIGLENLGLMTGSTVEEKNLIAGQLYFFRAWNHFMLIQYWGGLPYIDRVLPADDPLRLPRLSYHECADKIAEDFQRAADLLPVNWDDTTVGKNTVGANRLRINKIMALAYLGKNYLWAGSPLMNKVSTGNASYNTEYCKKAADAFSQALSLAESTKFYDLAPFSQYTDLFYTRNQGNKLPGLKEAIFLENLAGYASRWRWNMVTNYRPTCLTPGGIKVYPAANYVTNYGMKNGYPIPDITSADAESGYDPQYPWKDRDPRFYKDIIYDGVQCTLTPRTATLNNKIVDIQYASLANDGVYRNFPNTARAAETGFILTKLCPPLNNQWDGYQENNVLVLSFMRLADVYLMYAEAAAVGYGSPLGKAGNYSLTALDAINKIRTRAGVEGIADKFTGQTEKFLSEVRRERAVELAFEGHRFVDLRRWLLLLERPYTLKTSLQFNRAVEDLDYKNPQNARVINVKEKVLIERQFGQKHYWFPFLKNDVNLYAEFEQNPGW